MTNQMSKHAHGLGLRGKSPQAHLDRARRFISAAELTLPSSVDLSSHVKYVYDQYDGYCVSHGTTGAFALLANIVAGDNPQLPLLSPAFVQCWAETHDGDFPTYAGSYVGSGLYALENQGVSTAALFPPESDVKNGMPPSAADVDALTRKVTSALLLNNGGAGQALVDAMKQNLASGFPCVGGFTVYDSFDLGQYIQMPPISSTDLIWGGHCVYFVGYDDNATAWGQTGYFKLCNSWGTDWSMGGFAWLPYAYLLTEAFEVYDFWTIRADTDPLPPGQTMTTTTIVPNAASVAGVNPTGTITIVATYSGDANNATSSAQEVITLGSTPAPPSGSNLLINGGFEAPILAAKSYAYRPAGAVWTFTGNAGIEANNSAWGAAAATDGVQAAFLQGNGALGSISQVFTVANAGSYTLSLKAAQRYGVTQPIAVSIDGALVLTISPASNAFAVVSLPLTLTAGTHTIALAATNNTGDKSTFIDSVVIA